MQHSEQSHGPHLLQSEAGELISASLGPDDVIELGELIETSERGWSPNESVVETARRGGDVTIFKSVGVGVQDVAIAQAVAQKARELSMGTTVQRYR